MILACERCNQAVELYVIGVMGMVSHKVPATKETHSQNYLQQEGQCQQY